MKRQKGKIKKRLISEQGVTLVEMLVSAVIFSFIVAGIYAVSAVGESSWQVNEVKISLQQELRKGMQHMINEIRQAGDSSIINVPADDTWYPTITFRTPSGVTAGSIVWNTDTIQYLLGGSGNEFLQRIEGVSTKTVCQSMQSLQFRRLSTSPNTIEVAMAASRNTVLGTPVSYQLNFAVQLRN